MVIVGTGVVKSAKNVHQMDANLNFTEQIVRRHVHIVGTWVVPKIQATVKAATITAHMVTFVKRNVTTVNICPVT